MAHLMLRAEVPGFDTWKRELFDPDPAGRAQAAKGYRLYRGTENPNELIVQVEFAPAEDAKASRERLNASGVPNDPRAEKVPALQSSSRRQRQSHTDGQKAWPASSSA